MEDIFRKKIKVALSSNSTLTEYDLQKYGRFIEDVIVFISNYNFSANELDMILKIIENFLPHLCYIKKD